MSRSSVIKLYHRRGKKNYIKCPKNTVSLNSGDTWEHEKTKAYICYLLKKHGLELPDGEWININDIESYIPNKKKKMHFITEAERNSDGKRPDVVILDTGQEIEIETTPIRAKRFNGTNAVVIKTWEN